MELLTTKSIQNIAKESNAICIAPANTVDAYASSIALWHYFNNAKNDVNAVIYTPKEPPKRLYFLNPEKAFTANRKEISSCDTLIVVGEIKASYDNKNAYYLTALNPSREAPIGVHLTHILKEANEEYIKGDTATALLAGIIAKTENFRRKATTPEMFFTAAYLISRGAENEKIVGALYKERSYAFIKLWAATLSRFSYDEATKIGYSFIQREDFKNTYTDSSYVPSIINELKSVFNKAQVLILGVEDTNQSKKVLLHFTNPRLLKMLPRKAQEKEENSSLLIDVNGKNPIHSDTLNVVNKLKRYTS